MRGNEAAAGTLVMRAITLWQPWATAMALGLKLCETRSWATTYRGLLAIHAGKRLEKDDARIMLPGVPMPLGVVLGAVELVDCLMMTKGAWRSSVLLGAGIAIDDQTQSERDWGDWKIGRFAWVTRPVVWFREPVAAVGHQGLWDWDPPVGWRDL